MKFIIATICAVSMTFVHAQSQSIDKIVGLVNDQMILESDLNYYRIKSSDTHSKDCHILEKIIIEKLLYSKALKDSITITDEEIDGEINLEVRRLMMERFGIARYLLESKADIINEDQYGTLYRKRMTGDEPLVMVRVKNSTPEPDGSFREYFLRVPPFMRTAKEAVAWTFNIEEEQYHPEQET